MPTKPKNMKLDPNAHAADVVNSIVDEMNPSIAVPRVLKAGTRMSTGGTVSQALSLQTLRDAGQTIVNHQTLSNAFLSTLANRIGRVDITSKLYNNAWTGFKKGKLEFGETVEELYVDIIKAQDFDPDKAQNEVFKRRLPNVLSAFHTMNFQKFYPVTISNSQLKQAFLSFNGIDNLIGKIVTSIYTSANFDEFLVMRYLVGLKAVGGSLYPVNIPTPATPSNSNAIVTKMKTISDDITELASDYNEAGVFAHTPKENQWFIMTNQFANVIDVETLAVAFNLSKVEFMGRVIRLKSFGFSDKELARLNDLLGEGNPNYVPIDAAQNALFKAIPAVLLDQDFFMVFDNDTEMDEQKNAQGRYWNYFYHVWKTFSVSPFAQAIVFTDQTPAVVSVTVTPGTASAYAGSLIGFNVDVDVTGYASAQVQWSITGNVSNNTHIDQQGRLTIARDETAATITVTCTSWTDPTKSDTATVTIT